MADSERSELPRVMRERKIEPGNENGLVIATTGPRCTLGRLANSRGLE